MYLVDDVWSRQGQHVVVPLQVAAVVAELLAEEVRFVEPLPLDHRAHRAVKHHDALLHRLRDPLEYVWVTHTHT